MSNLIQRVNAPLLDNNAINEGFLATGSRSGLAHHPESVKYAALRLYRDTVLQKTISEELGIGIGNFRNWGSVEVERSIDYAAHDYLVAENERFRKVLDREVIRPRSEQQLNAIAEGVGWGNSILQIMRELYPLDELAESILDERDFRSIAGSTFYGNLDLGIGAALLEAKDAANMRKYWKGFGEILRKGLSEEQYVVVSEFFGLETGRKLWKEYSTFAEIALSRAVHALKEIDDSLESELMVYWNWVSGDVISLPSS